MEMHKNSTKKNS